MRDVTVSEKAKPADRAGFVFRRRRREKSHGREMEVAQIVSIRAGGS
jgi:hypothetical protein